MNGQNTIVYVRVKGKRPVGFVDPPEFNWNQDKEKALWSIISKLDDRKSEINWQELSDTLDAPDYFLKKRSYKLFRKHLELLQKQIERKGLKNQESNETLKQLHSYVSTLDKTLLMGKGTGSEISNKEDEKTPDSIRGKEKVEDFGQNRDTEEVTALALEQLQTSKIINYKNKKKSKSNTSPDSDSELSSSLDVSKSALEEALMDRLHF
ncbi:Atg29p NDAI_0K01270 [Naumovozyma dairenensis CBS 421]|uniref:Autophagy-related protein 29 n=1 Tax=Naumovozyma dairenensis (strain ATCC 10597 / BCRC 20456 / CBS 421 / NBRC 0211 / NRRL Y-12639) TaxID=1071378 RepID=G0WHQ7_NAUDC|nr:hypothetical protein NDAI_0K01270 [Naumovozyma dairenensis CBS 421]CCD27318.1 hypothetical protein NDAI_0K01270 [Naumovozyma dairenensis CBS 421]